MSLFSLQFETGSYFLKSIKNLSSISAVSTAAGNQAYKKILHSWANKTSQHLGPSLETYRVFVTIRTECNKSDKALRYVLKKDFKIHVVGVLGLGQTSNFS